MCFAARNSITNTKINYQLLYDLYCIPTCVFPRASIFSAGDCKKKKKKERNPHVNTLDRWGKHISKRETLITSEVQLDK